MAKFCGKCGSPLDENGLCPKCDAAKAAEENTISEALTQPQPAAVPTVSETDGTPEKPKKKFPVKAVVIAAAALAVIGALAACAFIFHWFGLGGSSDPSDSSDSNSSQSGAVITSQWQLFHPSSYGKISYFNLDLVTDTVQSEKDLSVTNENGDQIFTGYHLAKDGDTFYGRYGDRDGIYKITVTGEKSATTETLVTSEQLNKSVLGYEDRYAWDTCNFVIDGDYIYGRVEADENHFDLHKDLNFRIFRISKSGDVIEFVGSEDVRTNSMIVHDGWVYYADNGYTFDGKKYNYDNDRVGIYKMKTDGSEKAKLTDDFSGLSGKYKDKPDHGCAGALTLWDDKLYYLNLENGESPLWRMELDGSNKEKLTDGSVSNYAIDYDHNSVIYFDGKYARNWADLDDSDIENYNLYKLDLDSKKAEKLADFSPEDQLSDIPYDLTYDDGNVYFSCRYPDKESKLFSGPFFAVVKVDTSTGKTKIMAHTWVKEPVTEPDPEGFLEYIVVKEGEGGYSWKDFDSVFADKNR